MSLELLRLSPSGPIVGGISGGFIFRQAFLAGKFEPTVLLNDNSVVTAPLLIENLQAEAQYSVELELHARLGPDFSANGTFTYSFEYSTDGGTVYTPFSPMTSLFVAASSGSPLEPSIESAPLPLASFTGAVAGGSMHVRARVALDQNGGGADGKATFNSSRDYALKVVETLA